MGHVQSMSMGVGEGAVTRGLFVTGMLRSGTTLMDKLLNTHPQLRVASQPFFAFYARSKLEFLGPDSRQVLPITPQFMEPAKQRAGFMHWLDETTITGLALDDIQRTCTGAKGQSAPRLVGRRYALRPDRFLGLWRQLHGHVAEAYGVPAAGGYVGSKEVMCEEFVPHMLSQGLRCVLIVRDPRSVLASLNNGSYRAGVGDTYPILLNLRNWRKSAAYCLWGRNRPGMLVLRYEELVQDLDQALGRVAAHLGIEPFDVRWYADGILDQEGARWGGNSSFVKKERPDAQGTERWSELLDEATVRFIEFCTYPELLALGYTPRALRDWDPAAARTFREDTTQLRREYVPEYGLNDANLEGELRRRELLLTHATPDADVRGSYFIFDEAYAALRERVRG